MTSLIQSGEATTDVRLENESALLRALVRSIPDLVWLKNSEGIYLACNPEFERFFGAPETEIVGKTDYDFVDVKLADFFCQKDREAMAADRPSTNEEWITYASDGHRALLETIKTPMRDSSGKLIGVLGIARDITERRRLEEALREGEHKFRSLFEMANDGIFVMETTRFTFMDCNERGAAMYGLSREQVIGRSPAELTPERQPDGRLSADVVVEKVQAALAGQPQIFDWQPLRADGTPFDVEITLNRIDLAGQPYLQSIVRDISERKESERQFQREHAFRQQLIDSIPGAFYLFDRSGRFQMWNRNFETVLGFTAKEIENSHPLDFFSPEDRPRVEHAIQKTFETGASQVEAFFQAKDGTSTPYYFNGLRFKLETGEYGLIGVGIDITQRREAEAALRASEEKLRGLYDLSPLGIALTDMNGRYIEFNEAFCRICGYPLEELNSLDYWALTPKKYEAQERQQLDSLARTGRYGPYEKEYRRKDGSLIPLRFNGMLLVGSDGQQYIWSIVEDITQQKAAEGTIHNLNADLTATLQAVPDLLFDLDRDGTYLGIWAQKSALLISQREALLGHTVTEMLPPDAAEVVMGAIAEADERGHSYGKAIRLDIAEGERWFELSVAKKSETEGSIARFIMLSRDITERKQWEEKRRESEERWKFVLEGSGDGVWDWNIQTGDAVFSKRWKEMLGFAESEIANSSSEWVSRVHPDDMQRVMSTLQAHIDGETSSIAVEFRMLCKDGGWMWVLGRGIVISRSSDGKPLRLVGTNTDITERKQAEAAIRRAASVFANSYDGVLITDANNIVLDVNPAFTRITGYSRDEIIGQTPKLLSSGRQKSNFYAELWKSFIIKMQSQRIRIGRLRSLIV